MTHDGMHSSGEGHFQSGSKQFQLKGQVPFCSGSFILKDKFHFVGQIPFVVEIPIGRNTFHSGNTHLVWVSDVVSSFSSNNFFSSSREKWRSTSSSLSTTQLLSAFLCACLCSIFSSIVPVYNVGRRMVTQYMFWEFHKQALS